MTKVSVTDGNDGKTNEATKGNVLQRPRDQV